MKICDRNNNPIGTRCRSLKNPNLLGTIVSIDTNDDDYHVILWDDKNKLPSGFYGNDCKCEIVED
jgi:hypothetical protein